MPTETNNIILTKNQRNYLAQSFRDLFTQQPIWKKFGTNLQALFIDIVNFHFKNSDKVDVKKDDKAYIIKAEFIIPFIHDRIKLERDYKIDFFEGLG